MFAALRRCQSETCVLLFKHPVSYNCTTFVQFFFSFSVLNMPPDRSWISQLAWVSVCCRCIFAKSQFQPYTLSASGMSRSLFQHWAKKKALRWFLSKDGQFMGGPWPLVQRQEDKDVFRRAGYCVQRWRPIHSYAHSAHTLLQASSHFDFFWAHGACVHQLREASCWLPTHKIRIK